MIQTVILEYFLSGDTPAAREREGKFVQLTLGGREYLVFAPRELHRFHNQILAHFLAEQQLPHHWSGEQVLEIDTPELTVTGGGKYRVDTDAKMLELWDNSQVYGRFDGNELLERIGAADHAWSAYTIRIV